MTDHQCDSDCGYFPCPRMPDKITLTRVKARLLHGENIIPDAIRVIRLFRWEYGLDFEEAKRACKDEFIKSRMDSTRLVG